MDAKLWAFIQEKVYEEKQRSIFAELDEPQAESTAADTWLEVYPVVIVPIEAFRI